MTKPPAVESRQTPNHEDNTFATVLRFILEVVAWFSIQRVWGWAALVVAVLLLAIFNARENPYTRGIVVSGVVRVLLEVGVLVVGILALSKWADLWASILMLGGMVLYLAVGGRRLLRLLRQ